MEWTTQDPYRPRIVRWFAWYPVKCRDGKTRWLTPVWRVKYWLGPAGMLKLSHHHADFEQAATDLRSIIRLGELGL